MHIIKDIVDVVADLTDNSWIKAVMLAGTILWALLAWLCKHSNKHEESRPPSEKTTPPPEDKSTTEVSAAEVIIVIVIGIIVVPIFVMLAPITLPAMVLYFTVKFLLTVAAEQSTPAPQLEPPQPVKEPQRRVMCCPCGQNVLVDPGDQHGIRCPRCRNFWRPC